MMLNGTKLATYDHIKHFLLDTGYFKEGKPLHFVCSVIAGVCIAIVTSPIDVVKTRIMNQKASAGEEVYKSMSDCFIKTYRAEGFLGFYKGFTP
mmetsp:Transcript_78699/g.109032  ORF Transcript_78699/g.109032 Transcript_78699/m.109032 type:complete len:94 (+) Transcript_78699:545-826(+)